MKRSIFKVSFYLVTVFVLASCSTNTETKNAQAANSYMDNFHAFLKKFKPVTLPYNYNQDLDNIKDPVQLDLNYLIHFL